MHAALDRLRHGDWVHIFPEGTRGRDSSSIQPVRRGVGHLFSATLLSGTGASRRRDGPLPLVVPFVHSGMEHIMPKGTLVPRIGQHVTVLVGSPISMDDIVDEAILSDWSDRALEAAITARIEQHMHSLHRQLHTQMNSLEDEAETQSCGNYEASPILPIPPSPKWPTTLIQTGTLLASTLTFPTPSMPSILRRGSDCRRKREIEEPHMPADSSGCVDSKRLVTEFLQGLGSLQVPRQARELVEAWRSHRLQQQQQMLRLLWPGSLSDPQLTAA